MPPQRSERTGRVCLPTGFVADQDRGCPPIWARQTLHGAPRELVIRHGRRAAHHISAVRSSRPSRTPSVAPVGVARLRLRGFAIVFLPMSCVRQSCQGLRRNPPATDLLRMCQHGHTGRRGRISVYVADLSRWFTEYEPFAWSKQMRHTNHGGPLQRSRRDSARRHPVQHQILAASAAITDGDPGWRVDD